MEDNTILNVKIIFPKVDDLQKINKLIERYQGKYSKFVAWRD